MFAIFLKGFLLQASLILALGAQNLYVLNSGLRRQRHLLVATVATLCDALLILVGVLGVASIFVKVPLLKLALGTLGVGFLVFYGLSKLKEALVFQSVELESQTSQTSRDVILTTLAFSLLNPHVYLDTVVLVGGFATQFANIDQRLAFGLGAASFSLLWFFGLSLLAAFFSRLLHQPRAMRLIAALSGVILLSLAFSLGEDVRQWAKEFLR